MITFINSKEIIGRILTSFNITHQGWINLSPMWIADAIAEIQVPSTYDLETISLDLEDGAAQLTVKVESIEAIKYRDYYIRLDHPSFNSVFLSDNTYFNTSITAKYENGYIATNADTDDYPIEVICRKLKTEFDQVYNIYFPLVLDNVYLKEAIKWYVLKNIMLQGLTVAPLTFDRRVPDLNPVAQYEKYTKLARNDISFDRLTMLEIHAISNTLMLSLKKL